MDSFGVSKAFAEIRPFVVDRAGAVAEAERSNGRRMFDTYVGRSSAECLKKGGDSSIITAGLRNEPEAKVDCSGTGRFYTGHNS